MTPEEWKEGGKTWQRGGHAIFYREAGEGDVLVCLHGFPTSSYDWHRLWPRLIARYRVICPDFIGFGYSDKPPRYPYSLFDQAKLIEELLAELGVASAHLLAHDYGDTVALELIARHGERVSSEEPGPIIHSCCLLNGGIFMHLAHPRPIQKLLKSPVGFLVARLMNERRFSRSFAAIFGPSTQPTEEDLAAHWSIISHNDGVRAMPRVIQYMNERLRHQDRWTAALEQSRVPLRLVVGTHDPVSGVNISNHYEAVVPDADVVRLDTCGHYPQLEDVEGTLAAYLVFRGALPSSP